MNKESRCGEGRERWVGVTTEMRGGGEGPTNTANDRGPITFVDKSHFKGERVGVAVGVGSLPHQEVPQLLLLLLAVLLFWVVLI